MPAALTDTLCTRCGLCCDGSLFADVELAGETEATRLEILELVVEDDGEDGFALQQPCAALNGTRCGVYTYRPECCRTFECHLLQSARAGKVSVGRALERIARTRAQIHRVETLLGPGSAGDEPLSLKERCAEALSDREGPGARKDRDRNELASAMAKVERSIRTTFLPDRRPSRTATR